MNETGRLFTSKDITDWQFTDRICQQYAIELLIVEDTDPIWSSIPALKIERQPLYENTYYALFACGDYDLPHLTP